MVNVRLKKKLSTYPPKYAPVQNSFLLHFQFTNSKRRRWGRVPGNGGSRLHPQLLKTSRQTRVAQVQDPSKALAYAPCSSLIPRSFRAGHLAKGGDNSKKAGVRLPCPIFLSGVLGKAVRSVLGANDDWSISAQPLDRSNFRPTHLGVVCVCVRVCMCVHARVRAGSSVQLVCPHTLDMGVRGRVCVL